VEAALAELRQRLGEIMDLRRTQYLQYWDMEVWMPPRGESSRAAQIATLETIFHARQTDDRMGELLDELGPYAASLPDDSDDACLIRVTRRDWEKARRVPPELASEIARAGAESYQAWVKAREESRFAEFQPHLERVLELQHRLVECFAPYDDPYDVLLDNYERGMKTTEVRDVFARLQPEISALVAEHAVEDDSDPFFRGAFPIPRQEALSRELIERFGGTWDAFRLDLTVHPFAAPFGLEDIRLTTRYSEDDLHSLFTAMHECGHGLYEYGVSPSLDRTPLCEGASAALHESQSRLWENVVGRSLPFWRWFYPRVQEAFPSQLGDVSLERFHRSVNRAQRGFIRVDADETSYGLHVILRFELEQELMEGTVALEDLPEVWNARMKEFLGVDVPDDAHGVLQDVHWSGGGIGYFPTYALGNVISLQFWDVVRGALPDLDDQLGEGDALPLSDWLRDNLYSLGRKLTPKETIERLTGSPEIDPQPYLAYLRAKSASLVA
jgi:carboxypeptidase Taq